MFNSMKRYIGTISRRDLVRRGGLAAAVAAMSGKPEPVTAAPPLTAGKLQIGPEIYQSIGVRPIINCRGTFTVVGGSLELPEVRAAKDAAAMHFVQLDELAEGIGRRLAELTGAEWGLVSSGCAAGLAHATTACVTGGNPDLHTRVPDLTGFPKDEVVIPRHSRNQYDQAVRSVGVRVIEVADVADYESALGPKVAMVYVFAGPRSEKGPLPYDAIYGLAKKRNIPVLVDAAAEVLTIPNVHLQRGATLVGYSGGKCIRGPQAAGLLLGRKDLVQAAWVASAPHHGHGRTMKVGKEEAMAMLAAVEMWVHRDHKAEYQAWESWMNYIAGVVTKVDGVKAVMRQPEGLSNHTPSLNITWDPAKLAITGDELAEELFTTEPRITMPSNEHSVSITAYMMSPGEDKIVADRIAQVLSRQRPAKPGPSPAAADLTGRWDVKIEFIAGATKHTLYVKQDGNRLVGTHQGDFVARDFSGKISGNQVLIASTVGENHGAALSYRFAGKLEGDRMSGTLDMGEYLGAKWTATRHSF